MLRELLARTICTVHLGARLVQDQLCRALGEIGGIVMIYRLLRNWRKRRVILGDLKKNRYLYNATMNARHKRKREDWA